MLQPQQGQVTSIVSNSVVINNTNYANLLGAQISTENQSCIQIQTAPDNFPVNHPQMMMLSVNSQNPSPNMIFSNKKDGQVSSNQTGNPPILLNVVDNNLGQNQDLRSSSLEGQVSVIKANEATNIIASVAGANNHLIGAHKLHMMITMRRDPD